jgi:hypothetical protein
LLPHFLALKLTEAQNAAQAAKGRTRQAPGAQAGTQQQKKGVQKKTGAKQRKRKQLI